MTDTRLIIVGVDGSNAGRHALSWTVREATEHGGTVRAITAWSWDGVELGPVVTSTPAMAEHRARRILQHEIDAVLAEPGPHLPLTPETVQGSPADVLIHASADADLLVLGSHGHGRMRHRVLGSVSEACVRRATCPVVIIPAGAPRRTYRPADTLLAT